MTSLTGPSGLYSHFSSDTVASEERAIETREEFDDCIFSFSVS